MSAESTSKSETGKPPYRVPTVAEIRDLRPNGYKVISTFSGGGGSSTGYRMAGFKVVLASEFVPAARETYAANWPDTILDGRDIREVTAADLLEKVGMKVGELDVFDGSPPCASFSTAGKRDKLWGQVKTYSDTKQRTDDLFFEYVRLIDGLRPRAFVAENVSGLVKGTAKGYFLEILEAFQKLGYRVRARLLDAQWLGVPQSRQRLIFVGFRDDLGIDPEHPKPLPYRYSLREALAAVGTTIDRVVHDTSGAFSVGDVTDRPCPAITVGGQQVNACHYKVFEGGVFADEKAARDASLEPFAIGREWKKLKPGDASEKFFNLVKPREDVPCPTITGKGGYPGIAAVTHPTAARKFTIDELKAVCSFPPDYVLTGTYQQQWERCGRAVPPLMMRAVAEVVRDQLLAHDGRPAYVAASEAEHVRDRGRRRAKSK